ncbi:MAG: hypothetical protein ACRCW6_03410 [Mycoplasmoidaceae bacterium]
MKKLVEPRLVEIKPEEELKIAKSISVKLLNDKESFAEIKQALDYLAKI